MWSIPCYLSGLFSSWVPLARPLLLPHWLPCSLWNTPSPKGPYSKCLSAWKYVLSQGSPWFPPSLSLNLTFQCPPFFMLSPIADCPRPCLQCFSSLCPHLPQTSLFNTLPLNLFIHCLLPFPLQRQPDRVWAQWGQESSPILLTNVAQVPRFVPHGYMISKLWMNFKMFYNSSQPFLNGYCTFFIL